MYKGTPDRTLNLIKNVKDIVFFLLEKCLFMRVSPLLLINKKCSVAKFKEFERRFKFKPWLKYGWFHLKLYQMFQDLSRLLI